MKTLRVLKKFRDESNFFLLHEVGSVVVVDTARAARLVKGGLCEVIEEPVTGRKSTSANPAEEKKEDPVENSATVMEKKSNDEERSVGTKKTNKSRRR